MYISPDIKVVKKTAMVPNRVDIAIAEVGSLLITPILIRTFEIAKRTPPKIARVIASVINLTFHYMKTLDYQHNGVNT